MTHHRESAGPRANLEIKARCADLDAARERVSRIATRRVGLDRQVDTYFRTHSGWLKLRESSLRGGQLVPYLRPDQPGPKLADYRVVPVEDPRGLKALLGEILGVHCVVEKRREIFLYQNVRIHLDRVKGLGSFLELEAVFDGSEAGLADQRRKVDFLMKELGVRDEHLVSTSYEGLLED
jgi:predicted adenylyl cyclase CyaB